MSKRYSERDSERDKLRLVLGWASQGEAAKAGNRGMQFVECGGAGAAGGRDTGGRKSVRCPAFAALGPPRKQPKLRLLTVTFAHPPVLAARRPPCQSYQWWFLGRLLISACLISACWRRRLRSVFGCVVWWAVVKFFAISALSCASIRLFKTLRQKSPQF